MLLQYMRRVLHVGCGSGELGSKLKSEGLEVHGIEGDADLAAQARNRLASVIQTVSFPLPFVQGYFDCIVLDNASLLAGSLSAGLEKALPLLSPWGAIYISLQGCGKPREDIDQLLVSAGLVYYIGWKLDADGVIGAVVRGDLGQAEAVMAVRKTYDPVVHARRLFKAGKPLWSIEVLSNIPEAFLADPETMGIVAAEKQLCLLALDRASKPEGRLNRFAGEQREFYTATNFAPCCHQAYLCHAEFWRAIGNTDMAARLLRNIQHVAPNQGVAAQLALYPTEKAPQTEEEAPPVWQGSPPTPNVLFFCHKGSDYGMDTLYDGLCTVLGCEHVVEFPWKPTLHGQAFEQAYSYPCTFNHPGQPRDLEWVCRKLRGGHFDIVLFVDTLMTLDREMVTEVLDAAGDVPLFLLDTWDEPGDYLADMLRHIGRDRVRAQFKREMLACGQYSPNTFPMPFAYPDGRAPADISGERTEALFWAGKREDGLRRLYIEYLEARFGRRLDKKYAPDEYMRAVDNAVIGLNLFGLGFDTVRYWELPAHGCMLLSDRPPIRIPHNFTDGESAVFFDDVAELEEKLAYYLAHLDEAAVIARAGHQHFKQYHTGSARARQLLGRVDEVLRKDTSCRLSA